MKRPFFDVASKRLFKKKKWTLSVIIHTPAMHTFLVITISSRTHLIRIAWGNGFLDSGRICRIWSLFTWIYEAYLSIVVSAVARCLDLDLNGKRPAVTSHDNFSSYLIGRSWFNHFRSFSIGGNGGSCTNREWPISQFLTNCQNVTF